MGIWACRIEEEGLGDVARCFWVGGLNLLSAKHSALFVFEPSLYHHRTAPCTDFNSVYIPDTFPVFQGFAIKCPFPAPNPCAITLCRSVPSHTFHRYATMVEGPGFHNRGPYIALKIHSLLISLTKEPSEYDKITPKIEFWIENVLREVQ